MNCRRFKRLLWSYVDGALSAAEQRVCEEHLRHCVRCRQQLEAAQLTRASLRSLSRHSAPARLMERVRAELAAQPTHQRTGEQASQQVGIPHFARNDKRAGERGFLPLWRWALVPALGVLVALLGWNLLSIQQMESKHSLEPQVQQASQEYAETCIDLHQQLEMVEWAGTPTASYLITTSYTR